MHVRYPGGCCTDLLVGSAGLDGVALGALLLEKLGSLGGGHGKLPTEGGEAGVSVWAATHRCWRAVR